MIVVLGEVSSATRSGRPTQVEVLSRWSLLGNVMIALRGRRYACSSGLEPDRREAPDENGFAKVTIRATGGRIGWLWHRSHTGVYRAAGTAMVLVLAAGQLSVGWNWLFAAVVPAHEQMRITFIAEDIRKLSRALSALKREHSVARPAEG
ncbi:hypothetical protein [Streptomyces sp. MBT84]|uniref:hypothetical protein n=1 Tax=Streptomyces sp. MBT84 TaxID=1488414 RepID=UPI001C6E0E15|nr:hypothetical protein [Streptomyces sp. MBT84]